MAQFKSINPKVEVNGQTVLSLAKGLGAFENLGMKYLADCNIKDIKVDGWYLQQDWLDAFKLISEKVGANTLHKIGASIPDNAKFPPEINDIYKALSAIDIAYHMNHRLDGKTLFDITSGKLSEGIGHYHYQKISDNKIEIKCDNPYPCDFDKGIIYQMAKRFKPTGAIIKLEHISESCRKNGDNICTYIVTW